MSFEVPSWVYVQGAALYQNVRSSTDLVLSLTKRVGWAVWRSLTPMTYVFFEHSFYPWPKHDIILNSAVAPPVEWNYIPAQRLFEQPMSVKQPRHLSWLSAQIKHGGDLVVQDITEFVNNVRWIGEAAPKPEHILAAWTLETGIVLNPALPLRIAVITDEGTEQTFQLYENHVSRAAPASATS